ncbi:hypothetical protein PV10_03085 [Exophiala mesophila]|uniref:Uncharacterized protein n=1 Tax=Exophiala mesophila TaxID=212818 RepID=A0A0D1ZLD3_EXOME|nr:uncharacterized protein PV10_03085 [Exophiala mesophila]KIV95427.1 hypothetical protein PV10_03085 [Exophiala mesophila]
MATTSDRQTLTVYAAKEDVKRNQSIILDRGDAWRLVLPNDDTQRVNARDCLVDLFERRPTPIIPLYERMEDAITRARALKDRSRTDGDRVQAVNLVGRRYRELVAYRTDIRYEGRAPPMAASGRVFLIFDTIDAVEENRGRTLRRRGGRVIERSASGRLQERRSSSRK